MIFFAPEGLKNDLAKSPASFLSKLRVSLIKVQNPFFLDPGTHNDIPARI